MRDPAEMLLCVNPEPADSLNDGNAKTLGLMPPGSVHTFSIAARRAPGAKRLSGLVGLLRRQALLLDAQAGIFYAEEGCLLNEGTVLL